MTLTFARRLAGHLNKLALLADRAHRQSLRQTDYESRAAISRAGTTTHLRAWMALGLLLGAASTGVPTIQAADSPELCAITGDGVVPITERCANKTYAEWSAAFWQYALGQPTASSPLLDPTGANCHVGQSGPVFFLASSWDGSPADRTCAVPAGKPVFFPLISIIDVSTPPGFCRRLPALIQAGAVCLAESPDKLLADIKPIQDGVQDLVATIDGVAVPNPTRFRVQSPAFSLYLPADNLFGGLLPKQAYMAVADGYYLMIAPLPAGEHTIHFAGATPLNQFSQNVTYTLFY